MPLPPPDPETRWQELWHDLPPETAQMAWACTAFARARTIKTPAHLGRVVVLDGGLDNPGRAVAGKVPARAGPITEHAVAERWRACGPWGNAVLRPLLPRPWVATRPHALRVVVIDARSRQAPGAPETDERLPINRDVRALEVLAGSIPEVPTGETLKYWALGPGEVAITARGAAPPRGMGMRSTGERRSSSGCTPSVWCWVTPLGIRGRWGTPGSASEPTPSAPCRW